MYDLQQAVDAKYLRENFTNDLDVLVRGLAEEVGEVTAASLDLDSRFRAKSDRKPSDLEHELWDAIVYIAAIANSAEIELGLFVDNVRKIDDH